MKSSNIQHKGESGMRPLSSNHSKFLAFITLIAVGLTGCVPPQPALNTSMYKTVGVISVLPPNIQMIHVGMTVFGNDAKQFPLGIDQNATAEAMAASLLTPGHQFRDLSQYRAPLSAALAAPQPDDHDMETAAISAELSKTVPPGTADLILVFSLPDNESAGFGALPMPGPKGLPAAFYSTGKYNPFTPDDTFSVNLLVQAFDGRTFQRVSSSFPTNPVVSGLNWNGQSYDSLSSAQKTAMADAEKHTLSLTVTAALKELNLAP